MKFNGFVDQFHEVRDFGDFDEFNPKVQSSPSSIQDGRGNSSPSARIDAK
jgi:hypothetical protein